MIAAEIAQEAHTHCGEYPDHQWISHMYTSSYYAAYLNAHDIQTTPKAVIDAIIAIAGDPEQKKWTRHPHPDAIISYLNDAPSEEENEG